MPMARISHLMISQAFTLFGVPSERSSWQHAPGELDVILVHCIETGLTYIRETSDPSLPSLRLSLFPRPMPTSDVTPTNVLGPLLAGVLINTLAYGVCLIQFFEYYTAGFKDKPLIRYVPLFLVYYTTV